MDSLRSVVRKRGSQQVIAEASSVTVMASPADPASTLHSLMIVPTTSG